MTAQISEAAALAAAARAFKRAQKKGLVWIDETSGMFATYESQIAFVPPPPIHPDQLRIC